MEKVKNVFDIAKVLSLPWRWMRRPVPARLFLSKTFSIYRPINTRGIEWTEKSILYTQVKKKKRLLDPGDPTFFFFFLPMNYRWRELRGGSCRFSNQQGSPLHILPSSSSCLSTPGLFFFLLVCWCLSAQLLLVVAPPYRAQSFLQTRFTSAIQIGAPSTHTHHKRKKKW